MEIGSSSNFQKDIRDRILNISDKKYFKIILDVSSTFLNEHYDKKTFQSEYVFFLSELFFNKELKKEFTYDQIEQYFIEFLIHLSLQKDGKYELDFLKKYYYHDNTQHISQQKFMNSNAVFMSNRLLELYEKIKILSLKISEKFRIEKLSVEKSSVDFSDTKGTEKIIMLKKLGVLDFLKTKEPFNLSKNALASVLSGITGIDSRTVQSYINPIDNPNVDQKNNPLLSQKTVLKVDEKLISIGFKP